MNADDGMEGMEDSDDTEKQNGGGENENVDNDAWDNMQKSIKKSLVFRL